MFFHSIEFYVIAVILAAAVIGLAARPSGRGEARTWLLPAELSDADYVQVPAIAIEVDDRCDIRLLRLGLPGVEAVNMSVTLIGRDIAIEEHAMLSGRTVASESVVAETLLTFTGPERYHLSYSAPGLSLFAALQFTVRPGVRIYKELTLS